MPVVPNPYFKNHVIYNALKYHFVVGLIQLMIDGQLLKRDVNHGYYATFINFREPAKGFYQTLTDEAKRELISFFKYKAYLDL